jgi:eukaryotic-like serine/threonine-protein kinase
MDSGFFPESTRLGRYRIVKRLGGGDTSEVLLAVSQGPHGFERSVVLKRLLPQYEWDASMGRMLATEAIAYARLTHPAVVRLYDFFDHDGHAILVLEYVDGPSLADLQAMLRARREVLSDPAIFYIASRVFAGLAAAHAARDLRSGEFAPIVHRDVSPGSVLLPWDGFVKLGDFGFAKVKGLTGETSDTRHGVLKGTFGYMAPEQVLGERVTPRTDVYAGCLLLRELLLTTPAFARALPELELLRAMAEAKLTPVEALRGGISSALADAMRRGLARDPEERTLTAAEMGRVLRQETDLALAQMALVDTLARVRPSEQIRASTPPAGTRIEGEEGTSGTMRFERLHLPPEALPSESDAGANVLDTDSNPTLRFETPNAAIMLGRSTPPLPVSDARSTPPGRLRKHVLVGVGLGGVAACIALGALLRTPSHPSAESETPKPSAVAIASVPSAPSNPPPRPLAPAAAPPAPPPRPVPTPAPPAPPAFGDLITPARARSHRVFVDGKYAAPRSGATLNLRCGKHTVRIGSQGRIQTVDVPCGGSIAIEAP